MTTALPPSVQWMVGQMHRRLEAALITCRSFTSWTLELPWVLLSLRSVPLEDFSVSSAKLFYVMLPLVQCIFRQQSTFLYGWMGSGFRSHLCMMARTGLLAIPIHSSSSPSVIVRILFQSPFSSPC